jgi:hypothetical protein
MIQEGGRLRLGEADQSSTLRGIGAISTMSTEKPDIGTWTS